MFFIVPYSLALKNMKKLLLLTAVLTFTFSAARAQLSSTITSQKYTSGSDFWFALPSNQWGQDLGGKYMRIYITSPNNCTASVSSNGSTFPVSITAYQISSFNVPEFWEMESSGIVENKGIHVYCDNAVLSVNFMSYDVGYSDGSYLIPTIGLGNDYVVAAAGSLFEEGADYPSECTITATGDGTSVTITPSCNCRKSTSGNENGDSNSTVIAYPAGQPFTVTLNRGQSMQLMPVFATDADNFDLTGTVIHATQSVSVVGGCMLADIPAGYSSGNFVCNAMTPIRSWSNTNYAPSVIEPPGETDHEFIRYVFISSEPGQTIFRHECNSTDQVECVIPNQYGIFSDELELAQKFYSSAPFFVVGYINSATYPDSINGFGAPSEFSILTHQQYAKTVVFETPISLGNIVPYDDYANIICNDSDAKNVTFDGKNISDYTAQCIDDTFEVFNMPHIAPATHEIHSDSGVGVYVYSYGGNQSYALSVPSGVTPPFNSSDTIPPHADTSSMCYGAFIHVTDSGLLPNGTPQSGLGEIEVDSIYNMNYQHDADFIAGSGADTGGYSIIVVDPTKPAIAIVEVLDLAGNETTITTNYTPNYDSIKPAIQNLGVWINGQPNIAFDTIFNEGQTPYDLSVLHLLYGNVGFSIFDSTGGPLDLSPIPVGQYRIVEIEFTAKDSTFAVDSIIFGNDCDTQSVAIIGSGGANDFVVTNQVWENEPLPAPPGGFVKTVEIENLSGRTITIDSASWPDTHFVALPGQFPVVVQAAPATALISIAYIPDSNSSTISDRTQGSWYSHNVLESNNITPSPRFDSLIWIASFASVTDADNPASQATILPTNDGQSLEIILPADVNGPVSFQLVNVLGESVLHETFGTGTQTVDASALPRGVYFYRLTSGQISQSGKVILGE